MKKTYIETLSLKDLVKAGYKEKDGCWYIGDARFPSQRIHKNLEGMLGKKLLLISMDNGRFEVEQHGEHFILPSAIVKTKLRARKVHKTIFKDDVVKFNGYNFDFPCSMRRVGPEEAKKIAKWVLKVAK